MKPHHRETPMTMRTEKPFDNFQDLEEEDFDAPRPVTFRHAGKVVRQEQPDPTDIGDQISAGAGRTQATVARYEEECQACGGSGKFRGYSGRVIGDCYKCQGTGRRRFKSSPEARAKGRVASNKARARKAEQAQAWRKENSAVIEYMYDRMPSWEFAGSLIAALEQYGTWTDKQLAVANEAFKTAQAKRAERKVDTGLDVSTLSGHYMTESRLRLYVEHATKPGKWLGFIFVKNGSEYGVSQRYGVQAPGESYQGKAQDAIREVLADPKAAMIRYGQETGQCGACGATLENPESVAAGIGPVCANKRGW
jgi:hypothetical protein